MRTEDINQVVAEALEHYRRARDWTETELGKRAGLSPRTVANFLRPGKRSVGASGKAPSGKLTELAMLAEALGVTVIDLVTPMSASERMEQQRLRDAMYYAQHGELPGQSRKRAAAA